jgi:hypothetical protein
LVDVGVAIAVFVSVGATVGVLVDVGVADGGTGVAVGGTGVAVAVDDGTGDTSANAGSVLASTRGVSQESGSAARPAALAAAAITFMVSRREMLLMFLLPHVQVSSTLQRRAWHDRLRRAGTRDNSLG